jgi:hypothetical protein
VLLAVVKVRGRPGHPAAGHPALLVTFAQDPQSYGSWFHQQVLDMLDPQLSIGSSLHNETGAAGKLSEQVLSECPM